MNGEHGYKTIQGVTHVWSIFENSWVTEAYWEFINGRSTKDPAVRSYDEQDSGKAAQ